MTQLPQSLVQTIHALWKSLEASVLNRLAPIVDVVVRVYLAKIFFMSGYNKLSDWESTLYLFREEYHVPFLPPEVAAYLGAGGEVGLACLLAIGLFTRFAACGLFVLNIVAVVSYYHALQDSPAALQDHLEWGILLSVLIVSQVKYFALDYHLSPLLARLSGKIAHLETA